MRSMPFNKMTENTEPRHSNVLSLHDSSRSTYVTHQLTIQC